MRKILNKILFGLLLVLMLLPLFQELTKYFNEPELQGAFLKPARPEFSWGAIATVEFQKKTEEYENNNFGFRGFLVKLKNSLVYLLFKEISIPDQIEGKDGYIFSLGSAERTIAGRWYNGKEKNDSTISQINFLKEGIEKQGGHFLAILAPSKESVIPEKLPDSYKNVIPLNSDYRDFVEGYEKYNIPFIDFRTYFKNLQPVSPYPLFTKTGFHWSVYGASVAQDSLLGYLQHFLQDSMPAYVHTGVEISDTARASDADFEPPMNLLFSLQDHRYIYPKLEMIQSSLSNHRPKVIIIGDSFFWTIKDLKKLHYIFSDDSKYWYYFKKSFPLSDVAGSEMKDIDIMSELESADFVILVGSLGTLGEFPFGFAEYYCQATSRHGIVGMISDNIKNTPGRRTAFNTKAKSENADAEALIVAEARKIFRNRKIVHIKAFNNHYVCADGALKDMVLANREEAWAWETFSLINFMDGKSSIYSYANKFLCTELGLNTEVTATRTAIGGWETFTMTELGNDVVSFKASNGKYLSVDEKTLQIFARSDSIGRNEKFTIIPVKNQ